MSLAKCKIKTKFMRGADAAGFSSIKARLHLSNSGPNQFRDHPEQPLWLPLPSQSFDITDEDIMIGENLFWHARFMSNRPTVNPQLERSGDRWRQ